MLGQKQKECIVKGLSRSIRMIRIGAIQKPENIQQIVETAMQMRRDNTIEDFREINTTRTELLSFLHAIS